MFAYYKQLTSMRKASPALHAGEYRTLLADDARRLFAFARETAEAMAIAVFNADELIHTVELPTEGTWEDALNGGHITAANGAIELSIPPVSGVVLIKK
jgi:glycosidase